LITCVREKNDQTELHYTEPAPPFSQEPPKRIVTNYCDYDISQLTQQIRQAITSLVVVVFIHYQWGYVQPLAIQIVLPLRMALASPAVQIHLWDKEALGDLRRPWKPENPFSGMFDEKGSAVGDAKKENKKEKKKLEKEARKQQ